MTCSHCGNEIDSIKNYQTKNKCKSCHNEYQKLYMREYRKTEQSKKYHREYWKGGKVLVKSASTWD